jgi:hypothetical protein
VIAVLALLALVAVAAGAFGGMYALARQGVFDDLLRRRTATVVVIAPPTATVAPTVTPTFTLRPTLQIVATLTLRQPSPPAGSATAPAQTATPRAPTASPTATLSPTPVVTANPLAGKYRVEYLGCDPRGSDIGIVKGQIFDRAGGIVAGAEVRVQLDDWAYDQPAISNGDGWYEFYLQKGLKVKIVSLRIGGEDMPLAGREDQVFLAQAGCFEYVNLRQQ